VVILDPEGDNGLVLCMIVIGYKDSKKSMLCVVMCRLEGKVIAVGYGCSDVRWKIFHRKFSRTENFPEHFPFLKSSVMT
jgi:hypothetical protein